MTEIKIEINIDHTLIAPLTSLDEDLSKAITKLVENYVESEKSRKKETFAHGNEWTEENFTRLIKQLSTALQTRSDIDVLFSLLIAYGRCASNKPTVSLLKINCAPEDPETKVVNPNLIDVKVWNNFLRTSKARLTITCRNMGLQPPFLSPYGQREKRRHPIDPAFHRHLMNWLEGNYENAKFNYEGRDFYHDYEDDVLDDLRVPNDFTKKY